MKSRYVKFCLKTFAPRSRPHSSMYKFLILLKNELIKQRLVVCVIECDVWL